MPDTLKVPVLGPTKKGYVWAGAALVLGIVGYAWYSRGKSTETAPTDATAGIPDTVPTDLGPADLSTVSTGGGVSDTGLTFITTNAEWTADAVSKMVDLGYDSVTVSSALGKFLASQQVTQDEANLINTAIALSGHPPVGTFSIRLISSGGTTTA